MWEKESIIGVQCGQENPNPQVHSSSGKQGLNVGPSGWDFPVPTEHQWWILFVFWDVNETSDTYLAKLLLEQGITTYS